MSMEDSPDKPSPKGIERVQDEIDSRLFDLIHETGVMAESSEQNEMIVAIARAAYAKGIKDAYFDPDLYNRINELRKL